MVTDFDCWQPDHDHVQVADIVPAVPARQVAEKAKTLATMVARLLQECRGPNPLPGRLRTARWNIG